MNRFIFSAVILFLSLSSCSTDEDAETGQEEDATLIGTWTAFEFQFQTPLDFNGDGIESEDLFDELPCFTSEVNFTAEGSYAAKTSDFEFSGTTEDFTVDCAGTSTVVGVYSWANDTLVRDEGTDDELSASATISGNELTISGQDENFGQVTIVYENQ